jgi:hypothetical protein
MKETFEKKRDKVLRAGTAGVSRALEALLGKTAGACSRDLARVARMWPQCGPGSTG